MMQKINEKSDRYISRVWDDVYLLLMKHNFERVEKYICHGFDINMYDNNMIKACAEMGTVETVRFLIEHGADIHAENDISLVYSVETSNLEVVKVLMEAGANLEASNILNNKEVRQNIKDWCIAFDNKTKLSDSLNKKSQNKNLEKKSKL